MLLYYITDRTQLGNTEDDRRMRLLSTIRQAARAGVDYIQLREKDLCPREMEGLALEVVKIIRSEGKSRLLINHRTDIALAVGADGVHLTGNDLAPSDVRSLTAQVSGKSGQLLIAVSCHSAQQVRLAETQGADFAVLAPVFEKAHVTTEGIGLDELRLASRKFLYPAPRAEIRDIQKTFPVFALGGVDISRLPLCSTAGAVGVAAIRLFQQCSDLAALVRTVHAL